MFPCCSCRLPTCCPQSLKAFASILKERGITNVPLVWLLDCGANVTEAALDEWKGLGGAGIGPHKSLLLPHARTPGTNRKRACEKTIM